MATSFCGCVGGGAETSAEVVSQFEEPAEEAKPVEEAQVTLEPVAEPAAEPAPEPVSEAAPEEVKVEEAPAAVVPVEEAPKEETTNQVAPAEAPAPVAKEAPPPAPAAEPPVAKARLGVDDSFIQKGLRVYGRAIGGHPSEWGSWCVICYLLIVIVGFILQAGNYMDDEAFSLQWCVKGGKTETNLIRFNKEINVEAKKFWKAQYSTTQFVVKNYEDEPDGNILTRAAFTEIAEISKMYMHLKVTVNGKSYSTFDLCSRGSIPDNADPSKRVYMPCTILGPISCFKEGGEMNHASYQALDDVNGPYFAAFKAGLLVPGAIPFSDRQSIATLKSDADLKNTLSSLGVAYAKQQKDTGKLPKGMSDGGLRGCMGYTANHFYYSDYWAGYPKWSNGTMQSARGVRGLFQLDGPARIKYRTMYTSEACTPAKNATKHENGTIITAATTKTCGLVSPFTEKELKAAQKKHVYLWEDTIEAFNKRAKHIFIANFMDWAQHGEERLNDEMTQVKPEFYLAGIVLLLVFCACTLVKCSYPAASRGTIGYLGLLMVLMTIMVSFGALFVVGIPLNGAMLLAVPLLGLGLGLDDMFVFLRYFSSIGIIFMENNTQADLLGETMARAGPGAMLTSLCNCGAFFCGFFLPIRAMSHFCLCAGFIALFNFITLVNIFVPLLAWEANRMKSGGMDVVAVCCHMRITKGGDDDDDIRPTSSSHFKTGIEKNLVRWIRETYAPLLCKPVAAVILTILGLGLLVASIVLIMGAGIGYAPHELYPKSNPQNAGMYHVFNSFSLFPQQFCFWDMDVAANQANLIATYATYATGTKFGGPGFIDNLLTMAYKVQMGGVQAALTAPPFSLSAAQGNPLGPLGYTLPLAGMEQLGLMAEGANMLGPVPGYKYRNTLTQLGGAPGIVACVTPKVMAGAPACMTPLIQAGAPACMTPLIMAGAPACMTPKVTAGAPACMTPLVAPCMGTGKTQAACMVEAQTNCTSAGTPLYNSAMASCTSAGTPLFNSAMASCTAEGTTLYNSAIATCTSSGSTLFNSAVDSCTIEGGYWQGLANCMRQTIGAGAQACMTPLIMAGAPACMTPKITAGAPACMTPLVAPCMGTGKTQAACMVEAQTNCTSAGTPLYNSAMASCTSAGTPLFNSAMASCTSAGTPLYNGAMGSCMATAMALFPPVTVSESAYRQSTFAPYGVFNYTKPQAPYVKMLGTKQSAFYTQLNSLRQFPEKYESGKSSLGFVYMDLSAVNQMSWSRGTFMDTKDSELTYGFMDAIQIGLTHEDTFVEAIDEGNKVVDESPLKDNVWLYGPILVFWEVFVELEPELFTIMGIDCCIIFVVTLVSFGFDVITAIITCLSCTMIVLEIYGLSVALMNFNIFVATFTLMAMGMSVEFTAHLAAAFSLGTGEPVERLSEAMGHTFPALVEGSISTFCGIFPLAFHPQVFVVKYIFTIMTMVVVVGMINGTVFMPAMLALLAPLLKFTKRAKK